MTLYTRIESPLGQLLLASREKKLSGLYFLDQPHAPQIGRDWVRRDDAAIFHQTGEQLHEYASGERELFDLDIDLSGTPFQILVWRQINAIPFGHTITYSDLAQRIANPQSIRAVGTATGANPLSWIVPCHRVVGKNGSLTGYAGGLKRKSALLDFEATRSNGLPGALAYSDSSCALAES
jgi:methylated-DNA-[protein]-cysteine S-methyltransferase